MIKQCCMQSEILYSCALGGHTEHFGTCVAVMNERTRLLGDYNRMFVRSGSNVEDILNDIEAAQRGFERLGIPRVKQVELFPDMGQSLIDEFGSEGYTLSEYTYFALWEPERIDLNRGTIEAPCTAEYMRWYERKCRKYEDFDEEWWCGERVLRPEYIKIFKPYWLFVDGTHVGYMYCAETREYACVQDVNILPACQGNGYGVEIVYKAIQNKRRPVVLRAGQSMERFYGKIGFVVASRNKVINI